MCGRYSLTTPVEAMRRLFDFAESPNLAPRYNIAPTQEAPVLRRDEQGGRHLAQLRWGLIPSWAKDSAIGNRLINARGETVASKPAFRGAFNARRCLVPADGFYEWRAEGGTKQPWRIALAENGPFAFAGLWERWLDKTENRPIESFTIVTTDANEVLRPIHDRMPVILAAGDHECWLASSDPQQLAGLLRPYAGAGLRAYRVSTAVNSPRNDTPACIAAIDSAPEMQPRLI
ncbi:MAG: SOS response-associated peptidase [Dongiaceae bacterium]